MKVAVALALGLGTMVGWKRIVVTVGEKIGKAHLTYGQGAAAEIVAFGTIEAADILGLPVSTTHILSSGIAGTMVANKSGIQGDTVQKHHSRVGADAAGVRDPGRRVVRRRAVVRPARVGRALAKAPVSPLSESGRNDLSR